jgi:molybdopterin/thiamine biosynthesis adenylyltransferase
MNQKLVQQHSPITIIGAGGIGSPVAETLAGIGFNLRIFDHDTVGAENIGSQRYGFNEIGRKKVGVLKTRLETAYRVKIEAIEEKYLGQIPLSGIIVCGVDSLKTRAMIWEHVKYNAGIPLYLDGRVGGERFKLFCLNPCDPTAIEKYETHLDLRASRPVTRCTSKFAPQAGIALNWGISCAVKELITGGKVPFQILGENLHFQRVDL